jgi:5'-phosphate synthase pdxT subunit
MLRKLDIAARDVRLPEHLAGLDGLIIPGGESTAQARLIDAYELREPIKERSANGMAVWGTCAGMVLLAKELTDDRPDPLNLMDIDVERNGYGRQIDSFELDLDVASFPSGAFRAVFIRAPKIQRVGEHVTVLTSLPTGDVVAAKEGNVLVTAFHPELTEDTRFHTYFASMSISG